MKTTWNEIRIGCAAVGAWLGWFIGGFDNLLYALLTFVCLDYITGVLCACRERQLSSEIGFMGICRKVLLFVLVGVAHTLDATMLGSGSALRTAAILFYLSNEGLSIVENAARMGLPIPDRLQEALKQLRKQEYMPLACWSFITLAGLFLCLGFE